MKSFFFIQDGTHQVDICHFNSAGELALSRFMENNPLQCGDYAFIEIGMAGIQLEGVLKEINAAPNARSLLLKSTRRNSLPLCIVVAQTQKEAIDYKWGERTTVMAWERVEIENMMAWMSTLGGAFSALGDSIPRCADIAGKISIHQLRLAIRLGDPSVVCRSKLYFSISLIQNGRLRDSKKLIREQYKHAMIQPEIDYRLVRMCQGIWLKLRYAYMQRHKNRKSEA